MTVRQVSFDPLNFGEDHSAALKARNAEMRRLRKEGKQVRGWTLAGQLRPYASFGVPDGRVRNIYMLNIEESSYDFVDRMIRKHGTCES